ncbi:peptidase domain-containing ABC transporter [Catalinimonas niigatensis]|uniref:peptidase domain-containing ABC transporter n=1 Tax=Catalinimonas niigatensis TaxID=1397264 RepID=UPI0026670985|nr:peptidase domain-containing ABC transporter [Catalinimonas niigatensis]WPP51758.1 peptidase domain-containing ABC transporter [Catalinimonas niigatensis]
MRFPLYRQLDSVDCGPTCLRMIARYYGKYYSLEEIREVTFMGKEGTSLLNLSGAAEQIGFLSEAVMVEADVLFEDIPLPCIAHWQQEHFVVVYKITTKYVYVADPAIGKVKYGREAFLKGWCQPENKTGILLLLEPSTTFRNEKEDKSTKSQWHIINSFLKPYRPYLGMVLAGVFTLSIIQLAMPFLAQALVDEGIRQNNLNFIYIILIAQLVLFGSQTLGEAIRNYLLLYVGSRVSLSLLSDFLQKLVQLPFTFFERKNLGDLFQRITDSDRIEGFLTQQSITLLFSLLNVVVLGGVLLFYHWLIFVLFFSGALLYVLWISWFAKKRLTLEQQRFSVSAREQGQLHDLLYGMPEIKINDSQQRRRWRWEAVRIRQHQIATRTLAVEQWQLQGGQVLHELKNIGITFLSALFVIQGEMTLGMLIAVQYILGQLNAPLLSLIGFHQSAQDAKLSLSRLNEVYHDSNHYQLDKSTLTDTLLDSALHGPIVLENVSFRYAGPQSPVVLQDVSCSIPEGKVTAIVGTSGSGKTTLLKLLLKFYEPTEGRISAGNCTLGKLPSTTWLSECGVVMQDGYIFDDTILANITESDSRNPLDKSRLAHAVRIAHLETFIHSLPNDYKTHIGQNGMGLSGGQRQRILIARAVYKDPKYLFFDEATSALDAETERFIVNNLENFYQDRTVIIVAHRLSTVKHADQILVLEEGKVVEQGTHTELACKKGFYYNLVKNQLELGV